MRRDHYDSALIQARRETRIWQLAAGGLLAANLVLSLWVSGLDLDEKTHIVPPGAQQEYWIRGAEASPEYYEEFTRYLSSLVLNATPATIDGNVEDFLRYVRPRQAESLRRAFEPHVAELKKKAYATSFYPAEFHLRRHDVAVCGQYVVTVGTLPAPAQLRCFRFTYTLRNGRLWVEAFRMVEDPDRPFADDENNEDKS